MRQAVSCQSRCPACSRAQLSAAPFFRNMDVTISEDSVPDLITAVLVDSSPTAQTERTERASMTRFIQGSNKLTVCDNFSGSSLGNKDPSLSLLLNDTKKLEECKEKFQDAKDNKKVC